MATEYLYKIEIGQKTYVGQSINRDYLGRLVQHICHGYGAPFILGKLYRITEDGTLITKDNEEANKDKKKIYINSANGEAVSGNSPLYQAIATLGAYQAHFSYTTLKTEKQLQKTPQQDGYSNFQTIGTNSNKSHGRLDYAEIMAIHFNQSLSSSYNTEAGAQGKLSLCTTFQLGSDVDDNPLLHLSAHDLVGPKNQGLEASGTFLQYPAKLLAYRSKEHIPKQITISDRHRQELNQQIVEDFKKEGTQVNGKTIHFNLANTLTTVLNKGLEEGSAQAKTVLNNMLVNTTNQITDITPPTIMSSDSIITEGATSIERGNKKNTVIISGSKKILNIKDLQNKGTIKTSSAHDPGGADARKYFTNLSKNQSDSLKDIQGTDVTSDVKLVFLTNLLRYYDNKIAPLAPDDNVTGYTKMQESFKNKNNLGTTKPSASLTKLINFYYDKEKGYGKLITKAKEVVNPDGARPRDFTKIFQSKAANTSKATSAAKQTFQNAINRDTFVMSRTGLPGYYGSLTKTDAEWLKKNQPNSGDDITEG